jgi:hypothetical protein
VQTALNVEKGIELLRSAMPTDKAGDVGSEQL